MPLRQLIVMLSFFMFPLLTALLAAQVVAWLGHPVRPFKLSSTQCSTSSTHAYGQVGPGLEWGPCDPLEVTNPQLDCAYLTVPLDYHDLSVGNASIAMVKANATGERRGTVFYNPGALFDALYEIVIDSKLNRRTWWAGIACLERYKYHGFLPIAGWRCLRPRQLGSSGCWQPFHVSDTTLRFVYEPSD